MKFKSKAWPAEAAGTPILGKSLMVPDQSMSLAEIIRRFVRGEALAIGKQVEYGDTGYDLEKVSHMDMVDKAEFIEEQKDIQRQYDAQDKRRRKAERQKLEDEARAKIEAEVRSKLDPPSGSGSKLNT